MSRMRTLVLQLPAPPLSAQALCAWVWWDLAQGQPQSGWQQGPWARRPRPAAGETVIVVVPSTALAWHRTVLPAGLKPQHPRLAAALVGLLEEHLLQAPTEVQLALPPQWRPQTPVWVAACHLPWLRSALAQLQQDGMAVQRVVPEWAPEDAPEAAELLATGTDPASGWLWRRSRSEGLQAWPLSQLDTCPTAWRAHPVVQAEPGVAQALMAHWPDGVRLQAAGAHWADSVLGEWNLAQGALREFLPAQGRQRLRRSALQLWQHPRWRATRWGLLALLTSQWLGLQAWAWMDAQQTQAQQARWAALVQETFQHLPVVIDPPLQMAREVARLRAAKGQLGPSDLEWQLAALGSHWPREWPALTALRYQDGVLSGPLPQGPASAGPALAAALQAQGLRWVQGPEQWQLKALESSP